MQVDQIAVTSSCGIVGRRKARLFAMLSRGHRPAQGEIANRVAGDIPITASARELIASCAFGPQKTARLRAPPECSEKTARAARFPEEGPP